MPPDTSKRASDDNPLPRTSNGDGYTVTNIELADRLGCSPGRPRQIVHDSEGPYRPWFGWQLDTAPRDADRLVEQHAKRTAL